MEVVTAEIMKAGLNTGFRQQSDPVERFMRRH
jgi:hypothetical protein